MKDKVNTSPDHIISLLKQFKLLDMQLNYESEIAYAIKNNIGHREFLVRLLEIEANGKEEGNTERNINAAKFEGIKTLDWFDFSFLDKINEAKIRDVETLSFIKNKENVILIGPLGVGKSYISIALGVLACKTSLKVLFAPAQELMDKLCKSYLDGSLKNKFKAIRKVDLLIIYELGHFQMDKEKESIFFSNHPPTIWKRLPNNNYQCTVG